MEHISKTEIMTLMSNLVNWYSNDYPTQSIYAKMRCLGSIEGMLMLVGSVSSTGQLDFLKSRTPTLLLFGLISYTRTRTETYAEYIMRKAKEWLGSCVLNMKETDE